ncbi:hypothetical protein IMZ08_10805 [Bacillus luteolus]|uniref:Uncharacterized protein n=1 Tax=Litchfieldia luteola TaxID=682179 RepID=A0ABR9QJ68_9BACI|nr:hypothetical protein [Cytobacillus luteolus]MBE4908546.1 hypothetical protein [Cytobacillus luteolus]MBP1941399.1 hypothetical protein [Cytobacillus luteolus]
MAIKLPHIEDSDRTFYLPPKGQFETFTDETDYEEKVREWGLSTTKEVKKEFWYKEATFQRLVTIKGYEVYGEGNEYNTIVIEFQDGNLTCIHPAYLKEMQSPSFGKASALNDEETSPTSKSKIEKEETAPTTPVSKANKKDLPEDKPVASKEKTKEEKPTKIDLPEDKVHMTATVKQFALSWNHFNEEHDEVVVLENVVIEQDEPIEVGLAWCSHSKTLKKFELVPGEKLEFDGKIVKKRLPKGKDVEEEFIIEDPVPYKVNNPSKIKKS